MKCLTIVGARPQFIKAATVSRVFRAEPQVTEILVHTGQHYDENMSDVFFNELDIPHPNYHLGIGSGSHAQQTGKMLEAIEEVLLKEKPDRILIYGDTNSTLAGAITAAKLQIPIAHIEAGLRSFNRAMPEEINRILSDRVSDLLFAPTETAIANLRAEGIEEQKLYLVGDVMYDGALFYQEKATKYSQILNRLNLNSKEYLLTTIHRAENTDDPIRLQAIFEALIALAEQITIVLPLHPRTRHRLEKDENWKSIINKIVCIDPVGYLDMIALEKNAKIIATDSGGIQKEAFFYRVPCITLRDETEWIELVNSGWNRVISPKNAKNIIDAIQQVITQGSDANLNISLYGEGQASQKIKAILLQNG